MESDPVSPETRQHIRSEVAKVLNALNEARVKYAVWGAAACVHHGGWWLWKCLDYEILIDDWFDGPQLRKAVDTITTVCSETWEFDRKFDIDTWATSRGDRPPRRPIRRFAHKSDNHHPSLNFGIVLVPSASTYVVSMHHDDLVNETAEPVWIYPSLKNFAESQLKLWSHGGRNSALLELFDLAQSKVLNQRWADEVGLEVSATRRPGRPDLPSEKEIWDEILRMALTRGNHAKATARFRARRAEKEALMRQAEGNGEGSGSQDGAEMALGEV